MNNEILFIHHYDSVMGDTAWRHLGDLGFTRRLLKPYQGESLPTDVTKYAGLVIYGGSQNVGQSDHYAYLLDEIALARSAIAADLPTLGLCLGGQILAHALGARIIRRSPVECEFGIYPLRAEDPDGNWIPPGFHGTQAHYEEFELPEGAVRLASSERFANQAFRFGEHILGLQFHPETTLEIFREWQDADWAMFDINGSQSRQQQDLLAVEQCENQERWFKQLLEGLFVG